MQFKEIKELNDDKSVLHYLKDKTPNIRKTILSALFVLTNNENYQKQMVEDCSVVNQQYKEQKMSKNEKENWMSFEEIQAIYNNLLNEVTLMFANKKALDTKTIIQFFLVGLMPGSAGIPPRRSTDYSEMKIRNYNKIMDNYYCNGKLVFNQYKTKNVYGTAIFDLAKRAPVLNKLLKKWITINKYDYLLFSSNGNKLAQPQITQYNNKIYGKNISTDMLRHIYLTNVYKGKAMPTLQEMESLSKDMGHSVMTQMQYIKNDAVE
jgi:hypothetical protein